MTVDECIAYLRSLGHQVDDGMDVTEFDAVETRFGFTFGEVHREFLARGVPVGHGWWNWRTDEPTALQDALDWPREGTLFDVENNVFWPESWGPRPDECAERAELARGQIDRWPRLIPLNGHRYIPTTPVGSGSVVFSVYQTNVIIYGNDLLDYLRREFGHLRTPLVTDLDPRSLPPWSLFAFDEDVG